MPPARKITGTTSFQLATTGNVVAKRFATRISPLGLKPRHVTLLAELASGDAAAQLDLADALDCAPSLVVRLTDDLHKLGALERVRDELDRRRQGVRITAQGRALLAECTTLAKALDVELLAGLSTAEKAALRAGLQHFYENLGSPEI